MRTISVHVSLRENLQNSGNLFRSSSGIFVSCHNNVNYDTWHVYKPLFGSSVATYRLACSEISLPIDEKKLEWSPEYGRA